MKQVIFATLVVAFLTTACSKQTTENAEAAPSSKSEAVIREADVANDSLEKVEAKAEEKVSTSVESSKAESASFGPQRFIEGQHFQRLAADVPKANPEKPEVVEVFWYGCIHCYNFEPIIEGWAKNTKASNVEFIQMPAVWNERLNLHAKMYYTVKQMGVLDKMHGAIFKAMNEQKKQFSSIEEITEFFVAHGQDEENFKNVFNSFGITGQVSAASAKIQKYGVEGTPEIIVNGRYRTSARMAGSQAKIIDVIEYLLKLKQ